MPLFLFIFHILLHTYIHLITFFQYIYPSPFAEASLHIVIACKLSGKNLPVVPSRESNSGLPYSKPTCYQLCHAAPLTVPRHTILCHAAPYCATPHHTVPRRTINVPRRTIKCHAAPYCATPHPLTFKE
jgi:hypothetical protein